MRVIVQSDPVNANCISFVPIKYSIVEVNGLPYSGSLFEIDSAGMLKINKSVPKIETIKVAVSIDGEVSLTPNITVELIQRCNPQINQNAPRTILLPIPVVPPSAMTVLHQLSLPTLIQLDPFVKSLCQLGLETVDKDTELPFGDPSLVLQLGNNTLVNQTVEGSYNVVLRIKHKEEYTGVSHSVVITVACLQFSNAYQIVLHNNQLKQSVYLSEPKRFVIDSITLTNKICAAEYVFISNSSTSVSLDPRFTSNRFQATTATSFG